MSRDSGRKANTPAVKANTPAVKAPAPASAATVAAPAPITSGPVVILSNGRTGRPSTADVEALDAARAMLRAAIRTLKAPAPVKAPHGAPRRVRDAYAAENAAASAAFDLLKGAAIR